MLNPSVHGSNPLLETLKGKEIRLIAEEEGGLSEYLGTVKDVSGSLVLLETTEEENDVTYLTLFDVDSAYFHHIDVPPPGTG